MSEYNIQENHGYVRPDDLSGLPDTPGVYLMKDDHDVVIYVGKAIRLKKRVSSYFQKNHADIKTRMLVQNIALIDYFTVESEFEALILEANLIKKYSPRYNVMFKDNKFYPFIKVTVWEEFPRILFCRSVEKDGARYFGPYTSANSVRRYIELVQRLFKIRTCPVMPKKACLNYHIGRCSAPCIQAIDQVEYRAHLEQALSLLEGDFEGLRSRLEQNMRQAAAELLFEKAQTIKETLDAVAYFENSQNVYLSDRLNADFIGMAQDLGRILFVVSVLRGGKMVGKRSYSASIQVEEELSEVMERFILEYLPGTDLKQELIVVGGEYKGKVQTLNRYLKEELKITCRVSLAKDKDHLSLCRMAAENARLHLQQMISRVDSSEGLKELAQALGMKNIPMRIEGFDIANILGQQAVASLVSFWGGEPDKKNYRSLKIRSKDSPDDFAMIHEAVYRRYRRLRDEEQTFPDLILIDGGKGQLGAALQALEELGLDLPLASLAKKNEEIYLPGESKPVILPLNSPALHVLQRVRDETHRFANTFFRKLKAKDNLASILDGIPGIGQKRKKLILDKFLAYDIIKKLTKQELENAGIPPAVSATVLERLQRLKDNGKK